MHRLWWHAALALALIFLVLYVVVASRRHLFRMDGIDLSLFMAVCFWYLPKLPIALVLGIAALVRAATKLYRWLTAKKTSPEIPKPPATLSPMQTGRRSMLTKVAWSAAAVPYGIVANGMLNTLYDFRVVKQDIVLPGLPRAMDGFTLVQISDIHAGSFPNTEPFAEVVRLVRATNPDAIVITGDFVNAQPQEMQTVASGLAQLAARYPVYASLGNHDHYNTVAQHARLVTGVRDLGIDLLVNSNRRIGKGSEGFVLAGIDNIGFNQNFGNLSEALRGVDAGEPVILLAHDPTYWDKAIVQKQPIPLMLSGHTHGGQVAIGMLGVELSPASFVYEQVAGFYQKGDQVLYVNRGLGTVGPPLRIGVPPEITLFTLRAPRITDNLT